MKTNPRSNQETRTWLCITWIANLPEKQLFPQGCPQIFNLYLKKLQGKKIPGFDNKALFFNVPNSYNHKRILIVISQKSCKHIWNLNFKILVR